MSLFIYNCEVGETGGKAFNTVFFIGKADGDFFIRAAVVAFDHHALAKFGVIDTLARAELEGGFIGGAKSGHL